MRTLRYATFLAALALYAQAPQTETVMVTFHAKPGSEAALAAVIEKHWSTARRMNLIEATPHVTVRRAQGDKADFVHIFTWRDAAIPDHAPAEIQAIWGEMNALVEARDGHPGLDFVEVTPLIP